MGFLKNISKFIFEEDEEDDVEVAKKIAIAPEKKITPEEVVPEETFEMPPIKEEVEFSKEEEPVFEKSIEEPDPFDDFSYEPEEKAYNLEETYSHEPYNTSEKKKFKPTPIISPIYGVKKDSTLDVGRKSDEIILSASPVKKTSVDEVRKKAYRYLKEDINEEKETENIIKLDETDNKPRAVTVGDAEDYFNELGLEYNVDYYDKTEELEITKEPEKEEKPEIVQKIKVPASEPEINLSDTLDLTEEAEEIKNDTYQSEDDDLFDFIESMYVEE